jgi:hypothetical protein
MSRANLSGANLTEAVLYATQLTGADLTNANLHSATLTGANLANANLQLATLTNADLTLADTRGAAVTDAQLATAITSNTIRPDGHIRGLNLTNNALLEVRNYDGGIAITVEDGMLLDSSSDVSILLDQATWGSTITLAGGFTPELAGTLWLDTVSGVDPSLLVGRTFDLFDWNGQLLPGDHFDEILCDYGWVWDTGKLYTTGEVTLVSVPEPGTLALLVFVGIGSRLSRRRPRG